MTIDDDVIGAGVTIAACLLVLFGVISCHESNWYQASLVEEKRQAAIAATPHIISSKDGCDVYVFARDGRDHYYTRCKDKTTTESTWNESCGKNCTTKKSEEIVTETKP